MKCAKHAAHVDLRDTVWSRLLALTFLALSRPSRIPVDVIAYLSDPLLYSLRAAARGAATVHAASGTREFDALLTLHPASIAVVDPQVPGLRDPTALLPIFERHAAVQVIAYATLSPGAMRAYGLLASHGVRHLMLRGVDDAPERIRALLAAVPGDTLSEILVRMAEPLLARLPSPLARAVEELFRDPGRMPDVDDLARSAGIGRRTLDRTLERCGIASAGTLARAARVLRVYHYLRGSRIPLKAIAGKLGYVTPRGLTSEVCLMTGFLPSSLARELDPEDFLACISDRLWRASPVVAPLADRPRAIGVRAHPRPSPLPTRLRTGWHG